MKPELRDYFDRQLQEVMSEMPPRVHELLEEVTMYVEDHPSRRVMQEMGVRHRSQLCGLYTGVPLTQRHVESVGRAVGCHLHLPRGNLLDGQRPSRPLRRTRAAAANPNYGAARTGPLSRAGRTRTASARILIAQGVRSFNAIRGSWRRRLGHSSNVAAGFRRERGLLAPQRLQLARDNRR